MKSLYKLVSGIEDDIQAGRLTFAEIAEKHEVSVSWVAEVYCEMVEQECILYPEATVDEGYLDSDAHLEGLD